MPSISPDTAKAVITTRLIGQTFYGGWGTGSTAPAHGDTGLQTEDTGGSPVYARQTGTSTQRTAASVTNDTHRFVWSQTANGTKTITEAGIFDALTTGNLYLRGTFTGLLVNVNDVITFTADIQYT